MGILRRKNGYQPTGSDSNTNPPAPPIGDSSAAANNVEFTLVSEGKKCRIYCGECGGVIRQCNIFVCPETLYSFRCCHCDHCTPLFVYQLDALKYYKDTWGATMEWVDEE